MDFFFKATIFICITNFIPRHTAAILNSMQYMLLGKQCQNTEHARLLHSNQVGLKILNGFLLSNNALSTNILLEVGFIPFFSKIETTVSLSIQYLF